MYARMCVCVLKRNVCAAYTERPVASAVCSNASMAEHSAAGESCEASCDSTAVVVVLSSAKPSTRGEAVAQPGVADEYASTQVPRRKRSAVHRSARVLRAHTSK